MKANAGKRKIFDAVDLLTGDAPAQTTEKLVENGVQQIQLDAIKAFHDHPFRLYEGDRLQDMVESIREHGVLNPVIVQKTDKGYEMLSGHNRARAAKMAGLKEIPAVVKEGLTEDEAYVYVIETNIMQRSFSEMFPSEKAAVLVARYEKVISQGKRNDILREIEQLDGEGGTCGHDVHKSRSRDRMGEEYGMTGRNIARYMRIDRLLPGFKGELDSGRMTLVAAVNLSYLPEEEQENVFLLHNKRKMKIDAELAKKLREESGQLTEEKVGEILDAVEKKRPKGNGSVSLKLPKEICSKYFEGMDAGQMVDVVEKALEAWFATPISKY